MALPKLMRDIFENDGAGPKFLEDRVPKGFSEAISAPGASFTGNVSAATVNATSLVATGESNLGFTRIRGAGCLFVEASGSKGLGMSADLLDGTFGAIVSVRNANDPQNPGGIYFYTRSPESGINITHGMQFRNDGSLLLDGKKMVYVTDTKISPDHNWWYRKYSDGWIEQGGDIHYTGSVNNYIAYLTFPLPFTTTNYFAAQTKGDPGSSGGYLSGSAEAANWQIWNKTTTSCCARLWGPTSSITSMSYLSWYACGF